MALPSLSPIELQLLIIIAAVLIFFGSFLVLVFSVVFGLGLARLLYVGGRWCMGKVHHLHQVGGALPIVHHSH